MTSDQPTDEPSRTDRLRDIISNRYPELDEPGAATPGPVLAIPYDDLGDDLATDYIENPDRMDGTIESALGELTDANVQAAVTDLPDELSGLPGHIDPTGDSGEYRAVTGEITKATDTYSKVLVAAYNCVMCGTLTRVPQGGDITARSLDEPHECDGCDQNGPFELELNASNLINAQKVRVQTPPEFTGTGSSQHLDVFVEGPLTDRVTIGDRVTIAGVIHLVQKTQGNKRTGKFEPYMDGHHITIEETDHLDPEVTEEERAQIEHYASGADDDPLDLAADSLAPKIKDDDTIRQLKKMCILAMVGGSRVEYPTGDADRGEFHILMLGDPGTAKSKLLERCEQIAWRSMGISGSGATVAGTTAAAVQDDFGEGDWTLHAGAFVKANEGVVCIDELDDMASEVRAAMLEPMSKQTIHINKASINTRLSTRVATIAAGNPAHGRFDPTETTSEQFDLEHNLLSRFDLVYTLTDRPDEERDDEIADHILDTRDSAKRSARDGLETTDTTDIDPPVAPDILGKWIALAKRQPAPVWADPSIPQHLKSAFTELRGVNGYDDGNAPVPVTFRKLEGVVRVAEAAAKFEFSDEITERHARIATEAVGASMRDFGTDAEGVLDADIQETGASRSQHNRIQAIKDVVDQLHGDGDGPERETVIDELDSQGYKRSKIEHDVERLEQKGELYNPNGDHIQTT